MNKDSEVLITRAVSALNELGLDATAGSAGGNHAVDAGITLHRDAKTFRYRAEVKPRITPSMLGLITLAFAEAKDDRLLITDYVTPTVADELRQRNVQFADSAGNAFLNRRGLFVFVSGRSSRSATTAPRPVRVFHPSGIKVVFALLSVPKLLTASQRTIASAAGVALGSVPTVLEGLNELGFIAEVRGARRFVQRERLLQQWTESYARVLDPTLALGRFSAATPDWWRRADLTKHGAQWGGETAAALLHKDLRPERAIIYADEVPSRLMSQYRLRADPSGQVILRRRFWNSVPGPRADLVPPLLIYADLMTAGDARSIDAAKQIRDDYGL